MSRGLELLFWLQMGASTASAPPAKRSAAEIAPYPPMQWHSWGLFTHEDLVTEENMNEMADALVSSGMAAAGYDTVNVVCNGWAGRDPQTGTLVENHTLWPNGMKGFARRLHAMSPPLKVGCYTSPRTTNCMCGPAPQGGCEYGTGRGYEAIDMEFFASVGCDHVMVDSPDSPPETFKERYAIIGAAIANSSNPNMLYGVWNGGSGHAWKWAAEVGGHYWRMGSDSYDGWTSVIRQFDTTYSVPGIDRLTKPGHYSFLDQMVIGDIPHREGSAYGPGLNHDEAVAHMSMFVMAATPLLTCTDVRNMSSDVKSILTNPELLDVHKDPLARMATRVDIGGGSNELRSSDLCPAHFPACQEAAGDPGFPGRCQACRSNWSVYEKPLHDNSSAVMILNRGDAPISDISISLWDLGDSSVATWSARDLWSKSDLGVFANSLTLAVPAHGVRLLRMRPHLPVPPPPPAPRPTCPVGYTVHSAGLWANPSPCGYPQKSGCTTDKVNVSVSACARKCDLTTGCLAFEIFEHPGDKACFIFINELKLPFLPVSACFNCVKNNHSNIDTKPVAAVADTPSSLAPPSPVPLSQPFRQLQIVNTTCPSPYVPHTAGLWSNPWPCGLKGTPGCHQDNKNTTLELCATKCGATDGCLAFEVYSAGSVKACYLFLHELQAPFVPDAACVTCTAKKVPPSPTPIPTPTPPPPPPPPSQRGNTTGHTFPRLGNCWGADPYITPKQWNYLGFPNMTNASWGRYDVQYLNPFDSCCWKQEMDSWTPLVRAIKKENPRAVVLATYHATEIWEVDVVGPGQGSGWLPEKCRIRNTNGELCSWWAGLVFTNNLFDPDCMNATVFLDGVVDFDIGCSPATPCNGNCHPTADINCTHAGCKHTPQRPWEELATEFVQLYHSWFKQLQAVYPHLVWVNNLAIEEGPFVNISNGRMYEGGAGLDGIYGGGTSISSFVKEIRTWSTLAQQPSYLTIHMNANMPGGEWRIGRWQNLVTGGEMMRLMTDFRRMRFGLGVTLLTDGYYGYDVGSEMYGAPSFFTEYEAPLGQAVADPVRVFGYGAGGEVWTREFEHGYVVTSSIPTHNYSVVLAEPVQALPLSSNPQRLTAQREAPAWTFVVENSGGKETDQSFGVAGYHDWWADDAHRASFRIIQGNWTMVSDETQSHNWGKSFFVSFSMPGGPSGSSQGHPEAFSAAWTFQSPADGDYSISTTAVNAHLYPLTDGAIVCVREANASSTSGSDTDCIARSTLDQRAGIRDGRWQTMVATVKLRVNTSYDVVISWDPACSGYVAADVILVESHQLYHGGGVIGTSVVVGPMDSRVVLKHR